MDDVSLEVKQLLIQQKIAQWRNTHYDAGLDAKVAQALANDNMMQQAQARMKDALRAIDQLEALLCELPESSDNAT